MDNKHTSDACPYIKHLMKRIERMQSRYNMFETDNVKRRIANIALSYEISDRIIIGFVRGIKMGMYLKNFTLTTQ